MEDYCGLPSHVRYFSSDITYFSVMVAWCDSVIKEEIFLLNYLVGQTAKWIQLWRCVYLRSFIHIRLWVKFLSVPLSIMGCKIHLCHFSDLPWSDLSWGNLSVATVAVPGENRNPSVYSPTRQVNGSLYSSSKATTHFWYMKCSLLNFFHLGFFKVLVLLL